MVKAKTGITLLKRLGFVLIALPEPFTTPIGVALIVASSYLSRLREASINKNLRETLKRYLSLSKHPKAETDSKSSATNKKRHTRIEDPLILWQSKNTAQVETSHPTSVWHNQRDKGFTLSTIEGDNTIHHSVDTESLSRRYPIIDSPKVKTGSSHSDITPEETKKLIQHSIDMQMLGRRYQTHESSKGASPPADKPGSAENVVHHTIHAVSLSRRYPETVSARTDANKTLTSDTDEIVEHHSIKRIEPTVNLTPDSDEIVEHHSINFKALSQRYQMV